MSYLRRCGAILLMLALCISLLAGCAQEEAGVTFSACVGPDVESLDPIYAEDVTGQTVLVHLYENLMKVVPDGLGSTTVTGGMAKSVDVEENHDGTVTYTFRLRTAKWSDGEPVTAEDFVYAWQRLAHPASFSPYAELLSVVCGYQEAREAKDMSLLQVKAKNETTLEVTLDGNYDWFLYEICTSPATMPLRQDVVLKLKENGIQNADEEGNARPWWSDPMALVTNGPYTASGYEAGNSLSMTANGTYTGNQTGPETITLSFTNSAEEGQLLYEKKAVDALWPLTEERLAELAEDEEWTAIPQLGTCAVIYNCASGVFADAALRHAMDLAVDRNPLLSLAGTASYAAEGLVPYGVPENAEGDFRTFGGPLLDNDPELYETRCDEAAWVLSEAGYSRGSDLGELEFLYVDEGQNGEIALELCRQWQEALGVRVIPKGVTTKELWTALRSGTYTLAAVELEAPGNDAECFLMDWTSDSQDNVAGYVNTAYDTLMAIIASAADGTARMGCLHDAEALLLGDHVLTPLYSKGTDWELRDGLIGACRDERGWFSFAGVVAQPS